MRRRFFNRLFSNLPELMIRRLACGRKRGIAA
jgi:hypothetical protein